MKLTCVTTRLHASGKSEVKLNRVNLYIPYLRMGSLMLQQMCAPLSWSLCVPLLTLEPILDTFVFC